MEGEQVTVNICETNRHACIKLNDERHEEISRRIGVVENSLHQNFERIYTKFEEVSKEMLNRMPPWVTAIIAVLSSICTGLAVALLSN